MCVLWGLTGQNVHLQNCIQLKTSFLECANFIYIFCHETILGCF
jgi:hypothetical protein